MEGVPATVARIETEDIVPSFDAAMKAGIEGRESSGHSALVHENCEVVNWQSVTFVSLGMRLCPLAHIRGVLKPSWCSAECR